MYKHFNYILAIAIVFSFCSLSLSAQTFDYQTPSCSEPSGNDLQGTAQSSATKLCPSADGYPSTSTFKVPINADAVASGDQAKNTFIWVVYGGTITAQASTDCIEVISNNSGTAADVNNVSHSYSYAVLRGANTAGTHSQITVTWDTKDMNSDSAWVAVQQHSEWNCSDSKWSVFKNTILNNPPEFQNFPNNQIISYGQRTNFSLPVPGYTDDVCPLSATPTLTFSVVDENGNVVTSPTEYNSSTPNNAVTLPVGDNTVTWVLSDGVKSVTDTYIITVEPSIEILHVAWLNPYCGSGNGQAYVSSISDFYEQNSSTPGHGEVQYKFDSGSWQTSRAIANLAAGDHTVQARVKYSDTDIVESTEYTFTLTASEASSVNDVPGEGENVVVQDAACLTTNDGKITVTESAMTAQNSSISFSGDDYLVLNKSFSGNALSSFSAAVWFKTAENAAAEGTLLSFDDAGFFQVSLVYYSISQISRVRFRTGTDDGDFVNNAVKVNDGAWHLAVVTYNNGVHALYVDGEKMTQSSSATATGADGLVRYGVIGAKSVSESVTAPQVSNFFIGQIAEAAMWDAQLTDADVQEMMRNGMGSTSLSAAFSDRWVLGSLPESVSAGNSTIFSDYANSATPEAWARLVGGAIVNDDAPKLYSWTTDNGQDIDKNYLNDIENLYVGNYTLTVKDIFGCGAQNEVYNLENSDDTAAELYWNVALRKTASQSDLDGDDAKLAIDGLLNTPTSLVNAENNTAYWDVDLGGVYPVRMVNIHTTDATQLQNFVVLASQSAFSTTTTTPADDKTSGVTAVEQSAITTAGKNSIRIVANARYVRIRLKEAGTLTFNEIEVLTNATPDPHVLYLAEGANSCNYTITDNDASITPQAYDACGVVSSLVHNDTNTPNTTLVGRAFALGDNAVTWTATDDAGKTSTITINYKVVDEVLPTFDPIPFANANATITDCAANTYTLPIPKAFDNYLGCNSTSFKSLELWSGQFKAFGYDNGGTAVSFGKAISEYSSATDETTPVIDRNYLPTGDVVLEWRLIDYSGNMATDQLNLHIEKKPIVREVKLSPITCNNADNAVVTFSKFDSEKDVNAETQITYLLIDETVDPAVELSQIDNPVFNSVDPGTYKAYIDVNGCRSAAYVNDIVITNPDPISHSAIITEVKCAGEVNGGIELKPAGGSNTNILHFLGDAGATASVQTYEALDLTTTGSIEGWIYLDSLDVNNAASNVNANVGLFGTIAGANKGYGFEMVNKMPSFYVGNTSLTATTAIEQRKWYYLCGTWSETGMTFYIKGAASATYTNAETTASATTGQPLCFATKNNSGAEAENLIGFVRAVRVWKRAIAETEINSNLYLVDPIDLGSDLVANLPIDGGSTTIQNRVFGGNSGTIGADESRYEWQKYAFYWKYEDGSYVANTENIESQKAGTYSVTIDDPRGCTQTLDVEITLKDKEQPIMTFSNVDHCDNNYIVNGGSLFRYTNDDLGTVTCSIAATTVVENTIHIEAENNTKGFCLSESTGGAIDLGNNGTNNTYFNGGGDNSRLAFAITGAAGTYTFTWRYSLDDEYTNRPARLIIDGTTSIQSIDFLVTGTSWAAWGTVSRSVVLGLGYHTIVLEETGGALSNYDWLEVTGPNVSAANCDGDTYSPSLDRVDRNIGDCVFAASDKIFDPCVTDGECPADAVELTMEILNGTFADGTSSTNDLHSLDDVALSEPITIRWHATDKANNSSTFDVTYYIVDDEEPYLENCPEPEFNVDGQICGINNNGDYVVTRYANAYCEFDVPPGDLIPHHCDACSRGTLTNNINGADNLDGYIFAQGEHTVTWTYTDQTFPDLQGIDADKNPQTATVTYILNVVDVDAPTVTSSGISEVILDETGSKTVSYLEVINDASSADNCGISEYVLMKNLALSGTATQSYTFEESEAASLAIDGGFTSGVGNGTNSRTNSECNVSGQKQPWWEVDLGDQYDVYRIVVHAGNLENFHVLTSSDGVYVTPPQNIGGNWATFDFGSSANKIAFSSGTLVNASATFEIPVANVKPIRYVRIWNGEKTCMRLAEVEVYGASTSNSDEIVFSCDDIKYPTAGETNNKGYRDNSTLLLYAIDAAGNSAEVSQQVKVKDQTGPSVVLFSPQIQIDANGSLDPNDYVGLNDNTIVDWAHTTDACGIDYAVVTETELTCLQIGAQTIHVRVYDVNGNYTEATTTIYVIDNIAPVVTPKEDIVLNIGVDGYYEIDPRTDIVATATDNCTASAALVYAVSPTRVTCDDIGSAISVTVTVTDLNNNSTTETVTVNVEDNLPPSFVINNYTLTIPESGFAAIEFDDIVSSLADNCTAREDLLRYINYTSGGIGASWCEAGNEGLGGNNALTNLASGAIVTGSTAQSGHGFSLINDNLPAGSTATANQTYYATEAIGGTHSVVYNFSENYKFNRIQVLWANEASSDGNIALSHDDTYMPAANITTSNNNTDNAGNVRDGNIATSMALATGNEQWIQYQFTQPVRVANCRLRWASNPPTSSHILGSYDGTNWTDYGSIENFTDGYAALTINANSGIRYIRLRYTATNAPTLAEWYVYGKACTPGDDRIVNNQGVSAPDSVLLSHSKDGDEFMYVKNVTSAGGSDLSDVNDADDTSSFYYTSSSTSSYGEYVQYDFYESLFLTSTEIYWYQFRNSYRAPSAARIRYSTDGTSWPDANVIDITTTADSYNPLDLTSITTAVKSIRVEFTRYRNINQYRAAAISNWRVYGYPCAVKNTSPQTIYTPITISTNRTYLPNNNITVSSTQSGNKNYTADGENDTQWIPNTAYAQNSSNWTSNTLTYHFSGPMVITANDISWDNETYTVSSFGNTTYTLVRNVTYETSTDGTSWTTYVANATASYIRVNFQTHHCNYHNYYIYPGINEWTITGYPVGGYTAQVTTYTSCWETEADPDDYICPEVTTDYPIAEPKSATVSYSTDNGTTWNLISNTGYSTAVGTTVFPTSVNEFTFDEIAAVNALKLEFTCSDNGGAVGIYEWRTYGTPDNGNSACTNFTCADVHTTVPTYIMVKDKDGNAATGNTTVGIEPYFNITTLDIKDCGYTGERYYPAIAGLSGNRTYSYTWKEIDDLSNRNIHQSLFLEWTNAADDCILFSNQNDEYTKDWITTYTMPNPGQDWIELNTTGCQYVTGGELADGTYRVNLTVTDDNLCWDDIDYDFEYQNSNSTATSIDYREVCKGEDETFYIKFTSNWTFWLQQDNTFNWEIFPSDVTVVDGGKSKGEDGSAYGDYYVTVRFNNSTVENGGNTTDLQYRYQARGLHLINGISIASTHIETGTGSQVQGWTLVVLDSLEAGGPYFTAQPSRNATIPQGTKYVRVNNPNNYEGNNFWYNDYVNCLETRIYRVTVYDVVEPVIQARSAMGNLFAIKEEDKVWTTPGTGDLAMLCPFDTIQYHVQGGMSANDYTALEWSIDNSDGVATGRIINGGNWNDDTITVVWNNPAVTPTITVKGFNKLGCSSEPTTYSQQIIDNTPPVLGNAGNCSSLSKTHDNAPNACQYVFQDLPAPLIIDNCHNRIASYQCNIYSAYSDDNDDTNDTPLASHAANGLHNAAGIYDVGITYIVWTATDYSGNVGTCYHTVTVEDKEAPRFTRTFADVTYSTNNDCQYVMANDNLTLDAEAVDNCDNVGDLTLSSKVYLGYVDEDNQGTEIDGPVSDSFANYTFPLGNTKVVWTVSDTKHNTASTSFIVTVVDRTAPVLKVASLPDIDRDADSGECSADLRTELSEFTTDVTSSFRNGDYFSDNCTTAANLTVELIRRNDHKTNLLTDPFDVGTTTIYWRVTDAAGNVLNNIEQQINISDNQAPTFDPNDVAFNDIQVGYCNRATFRLPIPVPSDNCSQSSIDRIEWTITGDGNSYSQTGTITHAQSAAFNPNGDGLTSVLPEFDSNVEGSNYDVTWEVYDIYGNHVSSDDYSCSIHVQKQPYFNEAVATEMSCGNSNDGKITVVTSSNFRYEPGQTVEFTVGAWEPSATHSSANYTGTGATPEEQEASRIAQAAQFDGLGEGTYTIQMRVNGCYSETRQATITSSEVYEVGGLALTHPVCFEDETGAIDFTLSGGAAGQVYFNGSSSLSAADYNAIDLTTEGSIEAWVYAETLGASTFVSKGNNYTLGMNASGKLYLTVGGTTLTADATTLVQKRWYYVVGTWNSSGMKIYVDGADTPVKSNATTAVGVANANALSIGGGGFKGILREITLWNCLRNGDYPTEKLAGNETNLMAYWALNNGSGNNCDNKCTTGNVDASPATGASSLWKADEPQPGTYTWSEKNDEGNWVFLTKDKIDLTNLGRGSYKIEFQDPYQCPNPALSATCELISSDNTAPTISPMSNNLTLYTDNNECSHIITAAEIASLAPTITDACYYTVTWRVIPYLDPSQMSTYTWNSANGGTDPAFIGAELLLGQNTIEVTTLQNGNVTSDYTYYIYVEDDQDPVASGLNITNAQLSNDYNIAGGDGSGNVTYDAYSFNNNSTDNCTGPYQLEYLLSRDGTTYTQDLSFTCVDRAQSVQVYFKVIDESGNFNVISSTTMTVIDNSAPVFLGNNLTYNYCATVDATGGKPASTTIHDIPLNILTLDPSDYSDNCSVVKIEYRYNHTTRDGSDFDTNYDTYWDNTTDPVTTGADPAEHEFYEGTTEIQFRITDASGNSTEKVMRTVVILAKPILNNIE